MLNIWTHIRRMKWWWRGGIFKWRYFNQCHRRERFQVDEEVVRLSIIEEREWENKNKKFNWMFREYREFIIQISFGERWVVRRVSAQTMSSFEMGEMKTDISKKCQKQLAFLEFQIFSFVQIVKIFKSRTSLKTTSMLPKSALRWQRKQRLFWRRREDAQS